MQPRHAEAHYNYGTALAALGRRADAREQYEQALAIDPRHVGALVNLGAMDQAAGRTGQALAHYRRAIEIAPATAEAHLNRALLLLADGRLGEAWADYDWRVRVPSFPVHRIDKPKWDGAALAGRTLLVHAEQGLGDTLQFVRYLRLLAARGIEPIVQVQPPLVRLLERSGYRRVVADEGAAPECDVQVPLMSLPGIFGTALESVPAEVPYLFARDEDVARWRDRLSGLEGLRIGIAWQGSATHQRDRDRSIPLAAFAPLARIKGATLVSLQKGAGSEQLGNVPFAVRQLGDAWDPPGRPLVDTAAVMMNLDLVITADTAIAHLAGALGCASVGRLEHARRLAVDAQPAGHPLVSNDAAVSPDQRRRLGPGVCPHRRGVGGHQGCRPRRRGPCNGVGHGSSRRRMSLKSRRVPWFCSPT